MEKEETKKEGCSSCDEKNKVAGKITAEQLATIKQQQEDENGLVEVYSEGASEDFIYDVQDEWNLGYYKD